MAEKIRAALLQGTQSTLALSLREVLRTQAVEILLAENCEAILALLAAPNPPELILTDLNLPDGTWEDVVRISRSARLPVNVIVVSRLADTRLYMEVLQNGAFDFITPPFQASELCHVLRSASGDAARKRDALPHTSVGIGAKRILPLFALAG